MNHQNVHESPHLLPPVEQPRGWRFFLSTWTGRIIVFNAIVFLLELASGTGSLQGIDHRTLLAFGAKDPVLLAEGQWWRFITPIAVHGNLLHFAFNNWALFAIAYQMEALLKPLRFLSLYFLAGIAGNIASSLWSINLSVGASGSLFGLLGCALTFERTIQSRIHETTGYKPRTGAYTVMVVANILFGFIIPQIDNAAHIGGLCVGVIFAYSLLRLKPNRLVAPKVRTARAVLACSILGFAIAAWIGSSPHYVAWRLERAVLGAEHVEERYYYLSRWIELEPSDASLRWRRLEIALGLKDFAAAGFDLRFLVRESDFDQKLTELMKGLETDSNASAVEWLRGWVGEPR